MIELKITADSPQEFKDLVSALFAKVNGLEAEQTVAPPAEPPKTKAKPKAKAKEEAEPKGEPAVDEDKGEETPETETPEVTSQDIQKRTLAWLNDIKIDKTGISQDNKRKLMQTEILDVLKVERLREIDDDEEKLAKAVELLDSLEKLKEKEIAAKLGEDD